MIQALPDPVKPDAVARPDIRHTGRVAAIRKLPKNAKRPVL
jgi:hypothetical protein